MDLSQLFEELAELLRTAENTGADCRKVLNDFFQKIAKSPDFSGARKKDVISEDINKELADFARQPDVFGEDVDMSGTTLKRLPSFKFNYGGFQMKGKGGLLIYSENAGKGVIALRWDEDGTMKYRIFPVLTVLTLKVGARHFGNVRRFSSENPSSPG